MGYEVIISKLANRFPLWVRKCITCACFDPLTCIWSMIENPSKEFLEGGRRQGGGAKNAGRHDFVGPVTHEFCNPKSFLQSSQMYEVYSWFFVIVGGALWFLLFFGPYSSGLPQP